MTYFSLLYQRPSILEILFSKVDVQKREEREVAEAVPGWAQRESVKARPGSANPEKQKSLAGWVTLSL